MEFIDAGLALIEESLCCLKCGGEPSDFGGGLGTPLAHGWNQAVGHQVGQRDSPSPGRTTLTPGAGESSCAQPPPDRLVGDATRGSRLFDSESPIGCEHALTDLSIHGDLLDGEADWEVKVSEAM